MPSLPSLPGGTPAKSSTAAGGVTIVVVWLLGLFGIPVPAEVAVTIAVGLIGAVGWVAHRFGPKRQPDAAKPVEGE
ncbi:hypothetical protein ABZ342_15295 [Amycolatopsis sp. NPDC005961]|uniref:hypothetical protein n=1 Tax=Amycolatopsis sp. NPDC005961 TaxID=3156720 RepID=UPI0033FDB58D